MERSDRLLCWPMLVERTSLISGNELKVFVDKDNELTIIVAKSKMNKIQTGQAFALLQFAFCNFHFAMLYSQRFTSAPYNVFTLRFAFTSGNYDKSVICEYKPLGLVENLQF